MNQELELLIRSLDLRPHPEGGWFRETYRSPPRSTAEPAVARDGSTAIYFLLTAEAFSAFHVLRESDEMWHHYAGDPVRLHTISPDGEHRVEVLGPRIERGARPQILVPAGSLQAAEVPGSGFALCGCTVTPAFALADFEMSSRDELVRRHPQHAAIIRQLTRAG